MFGKCIKSHLVLIILIGFITGKTLILMVFVLGKLKFLPNPWLNLCLKLFSRSYSIKTFHVFDLNCYCIVHFLNTGSIFVILTILFILQNYYQLPLFEHLLHEMMFESIFDRPTSLLSTTLIPHSDTKQTTIWCILFKFGPASKSRIKNAKKK